MSCSYCKRSERECHGTESCRAFLAAERSRLNVTLEYAGEVFYLKLDELVAKLYDAETNSAKLGAQSQTLLAYCTEQEELLAGNLDRYSQGKVDALRSIALVIVKLRGE